MEGEFSNPIKKDNNDPLLCTEGHIKYQRTDDLFIQFENICNENNLQYEIQADDNSFMIFFPDNIKNEVNSDDSQCLDKVTIGSHSDNDINKEDNKAMNTYCDIDIKEEDFDYDHPQSMNTSDIEEEDFDYDDPQSMDKSRSCESSGSECEDEDNNPSYSNTNERVTSKEYADIFSNTANGESSQMSKSVETNTSKMIVDKFSTLMDKHHAQTKSSCNTIDVELHANNKSKRAYDKLSSCYYCGKMVLKMSVHLFSMHSDEIAIKDILNMKKQSNERKLALEKIRLKGDFIHNMKVLRSRSGRLLVVRRSDGRKFKHYTNYLPCIYCYGFFCKMHAYRHMNMCCHKSSSNTNNESHTKQSKILLAAMSLEDSSADFINLVSQMKNDAVKQLIETDQLLINVGNTLLSRKGVGHNKYISDRLRHVSRFILDYNLEYNCALTTADVLHPNNFNRCLKLAKSKCRSGNEKTSGKPNTYYIRLGQIMKDVLACLKIDALKDNSGKDVKNVDKFKYLLDILWNSEINASFLKNLKKNKKKIDLEAIDDPEPVPLHSLYNKETHSYKNKEDSITISISNEDHTSINASNIYSANRMPIVGRRKWNPQIKFLAIKQFKSNIEGKYAPRKNECMEFLEKNNVKDRTWRDLKTMIYNEYRFKNKGQ